MSYHKAIGRRSLATASMMLLFAGALGARAIAFPLLVASG